MQQILELKQTLWMLLKDSPWLFIAAVPDHPETVRSDQKPTDIEIKDNGILTFSYDCTECGDKIMPVTAHCVNHARKDIIPAVEFQFDCCDSVLM
jgi:hypothetical protein